MHPKSNFKFLCLLLCTFSLWGCTAEFDISSPEATLKTAYLSIRDHRLQDFVRTLRGHALEEYGNEQGLESLRMSLGEAVPSVEKRLMAADANSEIYEMVADFGTGTRLFLSLFCELPGRTPGARKACRLTQISLAR